jgi:D-alanyl-lipoteichoic acid acyltransferase DltB (MBOAT superfamily)
LGLRACIGALCFYKYSIFFPSLVAGAIKRYEQFIPSLKDGLARVNAQDAVLGIVQVAFGYLKKVIAVGFHPGLCLARQAFVLLSCR